MKIRMLAAMAMAVMPVQMGWGAEGAATQPLVIDVKVAEVGVVGSEAELRKQKEMSAGGVPVKIGIEALKVPAYTSVLVYCLWTPEAGHEYVGSAPYQTSRLGPMAVKAVREGIREGNIVQRMSYTVGDAGKPQIATAAVPVAEAGKYVVTLYALDGSVVAQTTLEVVKKEQPGWYPFTFQNEAEKDNVVSGTVSIEPTTVVPQYPIESYIKAGEQWRTYLPEAGASDFKAAIVDDTLTLTTKGPLCFGPYGNQLIARWWVNGKPVTMTFRRGGRMMPQLEKPGELTELTGDVAFHLKLDGVPAALGAKAGDKVEVEFLYCWYGWGLAGFQMNRAGPLERTTGTFLKLSNKAEFVVK